MRVIKVYSCEIKKIIASQDFEIKSTIYKPEFQCCITLVIFALMCAFFLSNRTI